MKIKEVPNTMKYPIKYIILDDNNKIVGSSIDKSKIDKVFNFLTKRKISTIYDIRKLPFSDRKKLMLANIDWWL